MSYNHLSINERVKIETLVQLGWSARAIASHLKRYHSTVSRELNRMQSSYTADQAQEHYRVKRSNSQPKGCCTDEKIRYITERLVATWSPKQIAEQTKLDNPELFVSFKTIYRWIYQQKLVKGNPVFPRHKGKRRLPYETRGRFTLGLSI